MNFVDGVCADCGQPAVYDQSLPILCRQCKINRNTQTNRDAPKRVLQHGVLGMLINNTLVDQRTIR
jgi:hypothetical protein